LDPPLAVNQGRPRRDRPYRSKIQNPKSKINNQQSTINNQQSTINNQQSSINNQQSSIINHQSSIINHQSSIINLFLFVSSLAENQGRPQRDRPYHNHTDPIP